MSSSHRICISLVWSSFSAVLLPQPQQQLPQQPQQPQQPPQPPQQPQQPQQPQHQNIPSRLRNLEQEIGLGHVGQIRERISRIENELLDPLQRLPPGAGIRARIASCESFL